MTWNSFCIFAKEIKGIINYIKNTKEIQKFNILMSNTIIPSYRHVIENELGFMYERHYYRSADGL